MANMFKESRAKKLLQPVNNEKEYNKNINYNNITAIQNDISQITDNEEIKECHLINNLDQVAQALQSPEPIAHCSRNSPEYQRSEKNKPEDSFPEDDDSVEDPNYKSSSSSKSSSSCSSRSSSSSSSSTTDSSVHTPTQPTVSTHHAHSFDTQNSENETLVYNKNILGSIETETQETSQNIDEAVENDITLTTEDVKTKKTGRKRLARVEEWLSNKAKKLRNTGQEYVSRSKLKKIVPARTIKPPCDIKCKMQCSSKIDENKRKNIFTKYWRLGDITRQRSFISNCMKVIKPAIRFTGKEKPRNCNNAYYFNVNDIDVRVCKKFFMATLDINDRVVRTVIQKKELGFVELDKRGKHGNHKKVDESIKQSVRDHINCIPRIENHYTRKTSSLEFIDGGKCITDLHEDYKKVCLEKGTPAAHYEMYAKIFKTEFNISFFNPKKKRSLRVVRQL